MAKQKNKINMSPRIIEFEKAYKSFAFINEEDFEKTKIYHHFFAFDAPHGLPFIPKVYQTVSAIKGDTINKITPTEYFKISNMLMMTKKKVNLKKGIIII